MKKTITFIVVIALCLMLTACSFIPDNNSQSDVFKKYEVLINYLEAKDYNSAHEEIDRISSNDKNDDNNNNNNNVNGTHTQPEKTETVQLTTENWKNFFELKINETYRLNAFGDVETLILTQHLVFKDEYASRIVSCDDVFVEMKRTAQRIKIKITPGEQSYKLGEIVEERELTPSPNIKQLSGNKNDGYYIDVFSNNYVDAKENADESLGNKDVWLVESMDCLVATRVKGTITFKK